MLLNGGLGNLRLDPRLMRPNEAVIALNPDLRKEEGALHAIKGNLVHANMDDKIDAIHSFENKLLVHAGDKLFYGDLNTEVREFSSDSPMDALNHEGDVYLCNGKKLLRFDGTDFFTPFIEAPSVSGISAALPNTLKVGAITAFTTVETHKVRVWSADHGLSTQDKVNISGTNNYDGEYVVTVIGDDIFSIDHDFYGDDATGTWQEVGNLRVGDYRYIFTWRVNLLSALAGDDRGESPPYKDPTTNELDPIIFKLDLPGEIKLSGLPTQDGHNLVIWRWEIGMGNEYRELKEIKNESTTYKDTKVFHELGDGIRSLLYETPPIPRHIKMFNKTLILMGITSWLTMPLKVLDNYGLWSDDRRLSGYSRLFHAVIGKTDDRLMNGEVLGNNFYFYTKTTIERFAGVNARSYRQQKTRATTGLAAEWALVDTTAYGHLFLGSDRRLHLFNGVTLLTITALAKMDDLFAKDSTHPHRMNWEARSACRLSFFDDMARLAYPSANSGRVDKVLNMDFSKYPNIRFTISDYGATCFSADVVNFALYAGNMDGEIIKVEESDKYLPVTLRTRDFDFENVHKRKDFEKINLDYDSKGKDIACDIYIDDQLNTTIIANKNGRQVKESTDKSFESPNDGDRVAIEFSWDEPDTDVVIYDIDGNITSVKEK